MAKGLIIIIYNYIFLKAKNRKLRAANKALNKRRKTKKTRIRDKRIFNINNAINLIKLKKINA